MTLGVRGGLDQVAHYVGGPLACMGPYPHTHIAKPLDILTDISNMQ